MKSDIQIRNSADVCYIDIEGTIGVPEQWQFASPDDRVATYEKFRDAVARIAALDAERAQIEQTLDALTQTPAKPQVPIPSVSSFYAQLTPSEQNELLKTLIEKIVYQKSERATPSFAGDLTLTIYPRLPYPVESARSI